MEQKQKLETADLLGEAAGELARERKNIISETPAGMKRIIELGTLEHKLRDRAVELRGEVQKVMKFPVNGSTCRKLQEMDNAIALKLNFAHEALVQFKAAEFDVVDEFRNVAGTAFEDVASLIRRTR